MDDIIACRAVTLKSVFTDSWEWERCWKKVWFNVIHVVGIKLKSFLVLFSFFPDLQQSRVFSVLCW